MRRLVDIEIELCPPGTYARTIISRARFKPTWVVPCAKPDGQHPAESPIERDGQILLNAMRNVLSYRAQPAIIRLHIFNEAVREVEVTYPDLLVELTSGKTFVEFKTAEDAAKSEILERTEFLVGGLPRHGYSYEVWTEREIREPAARLANAMLLLRLGRGQRPSLPELERIRQVLSNQIAVSWGAVKAGLFGRKGKYQVCRLVMDGILELDLNAPITDKTLIRWATAEIRPPPIG